MLLLKIGMKFSALVLLSCAWRSIPRISRAEREFLVVRTPAYYLEGRVCYSAYM